tara:strand:+ start:761 stop:1750 length:990 start_codon:yes stop_codon:yes gene_type:complete
MIYKSYLVEENINLINQSFVLLYGENFGLKNDLKKKIKEANQKSEIFKLSQDDVIKNEEKFYNDIFNISLFENRKVFLIDQCNDKIVDIIKKIEGKIDTQKIYLISDILDKKSKLRNFFEKSKKYGSVACYADNEISIKSLITKRLKGYEGLTTENINLIISSSSLDRDKLNNELQKIETYFSNKILDKIKLESLLNDSTNEDFNLLKDEALSGNKSKTNKLLSESTIYPEKNILYLSLINQRLFRLAEILKLIKNTSLENAIGSLKPPIFWKDKPTFILQTKKWNLEKIKDILNKTYDLEFKMKTNPSLDKNILLKKLIVDICEKASA